MLDALDDISWEQLHHAFGSADDVPRLLRALIGSDDERENAIGELLGTIWHQGTVYEASSYAVPFLVELALEPTVRKREEVLALIGALAEGTSFLAVHAPGALGDFWRKQPDFDARLGKELDDVRRTRLTVSQNLEAMCRLLTDAEPLVRAGAAYVLSRFRERANEFGPHIRRAANAESDSLARAGMLWCLGALRDSSTDARVLLETSIESADPRQRFAAAVALYRITGTHSPAAFAVCQQMAAATWFVESFLCDIGWDFSAEVDFEAMLTNLTPAPSEATHALLTMLDQVHKESDSYVAIVHDLLELNFPDGNWHDCQRLTATQREVLRRLVATDAAWRDTGRLGFLVPGGAERPSDLTRADIESARNAMRGLLAGHGASS